LKPLVVYGASGHAAVVIDAARRPGQWEVVALVADDAKHGDEACGVPVVGGREVLASLRGMGHRHGFVAVGDCLARRALAASMLDAGFDLVSIIHPSAVIADDVAIGVGVLVAAGAVINPRSRIGDLAIINTRASVDHDCIVERLAHLSPGVTLGGCATIKEGAWLGIGSTVLDRRTVGEWAVVGAGAVVIHDIPRERTYVGVPARDIDNHRNRK
jgi:sugar O-acyltransferase (sialic acid O-acetyltransferase NeuD family)